MCFIAFCWQWVPVGNLAVRAQYFDFLFARSLGRWSSTGGSQNAGSNQGEGHNCLSMACIASCCSAVALASTEGCFISDPWSDFESYHHPWGTFWVCSRCWHLGTNAGLSVWGGSGWQFGGGGGWDYLFTQIQQDIISMHWTQVYVCSNAGGCVDMSSGQLVENLKDYCL